MVVTSKFAETHLTWLFVKMSVPGCDRILTYAYLDRRLWMTENILTKHKHRSTTTAQANQQVKAQDRIAETARPQVGANYAYIIIQQDADRTVVD